MAGKTKTKTKPKLPQFPVLVGTCLGYEAYRGFGSLSDLAKISAADVFDQDKNRSGTQRNLSIKHARKAHQYVLGTVKAFYPELILNVRDKSYVRFAPFEGQHEVEQADVKFGTLAFVKDPGHAGKIVVSRLDGNHRLWFADGREKGMDPISRPVSFCLLMITDLEKELELFRDINDNQMGMNTSHL